MNTTVSQNYSFEVLKKLLRLIGKEDARKALQRPEISNNDSLTKLIDSIKSDRIEPYEFIEGDILSDRRYFYSSQQYIETREGDIMHRDDVAFCEYFEEYTNEVFEVHHYRTSLYYCQEAIDDNTYYHNGSYYTLEGLEYNDLVLIHGEVYERGEVYYNEDTEEYQTEEPESYLRSYHHRTTPTFIDFTESPRFYIGFEIEKEDEEVKESLLIDDFEEKCKGWRKERDGSLNNETGFELVSPAFELCTQKIAEEIKDNPVILSHVNANFSTKNCGGHINVSEVNLSGGELFDKLKGYTPLFYALYFKRVNKNFSKGKSNKALKEENEKYQAIKIHSNHVEFRIVSAVPNLDVLLWRTELINLIVNNPTDCPKQAYFNVHSILKPHLEKVYFDCLKFEKLNNRLIEYTQQFEGIQLTNNQ